MKIRDCFEQNGYAVINDLITPQQLTDIEQQLEQINLITAGSRELLTQPWCQILANNLKNNTQLTSLLPINPVAIQCTLFKKSADKNWLVPLHQDLSIAVRHQFSDTQFTGWSHKQNMLFVQPPAQYMQQLVAVRLHIDDCQHEHGPLKVVAGTHQYGRINESTLPQLPRPKRRAGMHPV
nr:phytanoyl-CoA dioxygenase family protein [Snodgrassella alvi]